jgi:asparagine synthase (glutamine-hydrolysing)
VAYKDQSGSPYDETAGVEALIKATGWRLNRVDLTAPDLLSETKSLMRLVGAPVATVTWLAHHVLAKRAKAFGHDFLFSGLGGDESLAGEFEHFFVFFADLKASGRLDLLEKETAAWIRLHDHPVFKKSAEVRDGWHRRNLDLATGEIRVDMRRYAAVREWFDPVWVAAREAAAPPVPMPRPYPFFLSNRLFQEMSYETSPPTLWSEALSSRAAGVKGIFPMTSLRCLSAALSAPGTSKYENGVTKMLLRRAMAGILPDCSRLNPVKTGFNAPLDLWLRDKALSGACLDLFGSRKFRSLGWLRPGAAETILKQHLEGERDHMMLLWPLISLALFLDMG